ncbi:hypothetical protein HMPREF1985_00634 [Mitsuokella sp. oral taxon 131 str. W9106]|nr:hypothetical protein HMPREF1985_00634 [Mitsuokella sp. oral taxon 131 str. W9106]
MYYYTSYSYSLQCILFRDFLSKFPKQIPHNKLLIGFALRMIYGYSLQKRTIFLICIHSF